MNKWFSSVLARGDNNLFDLLIPIVIFAFWAIAGLVKKFAQKNENAQKDRQKSSLQQKPRYKPLDKRTIQYSRQGQVRPVKPELFYARTVDQRPSLKQNIVQSVRTAKERLEQKVREFEAAAQAAAKQQQIKTPSVSYTIKKTPPVPAPAIFVKQQTPVPPSAVGFEVHERQPKHAAAHKAGTTDVFWRLVESKRGLRAAFVLSEVLGKPLALRDDP